MRQRFLASAVIALVVVLVYAGAGLAQDGTGPGDFPEVGPALGVSLHPHNVGAEGKTAPAVLPDPRNIGLGGVLLIPLIIGLVEFVKRLFPDAPDNIWLVTSFLFGVVGHVFVTMNSAGTNLGAWGFATWTHAVLYGLAFGLAASKAYDEVKKGLRTWIVEMRGFE